MQSMNLHMRDGNVIFHCAGCVRDFYIDANKPFVPQLRALSYDHHCYGIDPEDADLVTRTPRVVQQ